MNLKKILFVVFSWSRAHFFLTLFFVVVGIVGLIGTYKITTAESGTVYIKVKVSQGLWWAGTQHPFTWLAKAVKKGDREMGIDGRTLAEITDVRHYLYGQDQYDMYLTIALKASKNLKTGKYTFKRSTLSIASPIDFEFPQAAISGTVIALSDEPFASQKEQKIVTLAKKNAYPWEYDALHIGDSYFDGEEKVFEIISKSALDTKSYESDSFGNYPAVSEMRKYITLKAKVLVTAANPELIFGEEQVLRLGKALYVATDRFYFEDYKIAGMEDVKQ